MREKILPKKSFQKIFDDHVIFCFSFWLARFRLRHYIKQRDQKSGHLASSLGTEKERMKIWLNLLLFSAIFADKANSKKKKKKSVGDSRLERKEIDIGKTIRCSWNFNLKNLNREWSFKQSLYTIKIWKSREIW